MPEKAHDCFLFSPELIIKICPERSYAALNTRTSAS